MKEPPHTSVAGHTREGEEADASGKTAYLAAGLVLREGQWPPTQRTAFRGMSAKPTMEPACPGSGIPMLVGVGQKQHEAVAVTLF